MVQLIDTAGRRDSRSDSIEEQSQSLGAREAAVADLLIVCTDASAQPDPFEPPAAGAAIAQIEVATKCDLASAEPGMLATSAVTGQGIVELKESIANQARRRRDHGMAPSTSRCQAHIQAALGHLRQAHQAVLFDESHEFVAVELRGALDELGQLVGAVYTDDLLDRIFGRFCIGK
jgi:tRNA modification GTPase